MEIVLGITAVLAVLAVFIATRPTDFRLSRQRTIAAPPDVAHMYVSDFKKWPEWSPWENIDPTMTREVSGPPSGTGASYHWSGNSKAGEGRMTITDSRPPESVTIRLEFLKPWKATNITQFDFVPSGAGTNVTWSMTGQRNFMLKAMGLFMDMEKMVGPDFERGLVGLDTATAPRT